MFNAHLISSLIKGIQPTASNVLSLTPGQVLMGEVTKILPDQSAMVRFGSMQIHAKLDAALEVGRRSWFQVQPISNPITLKILPVQAHRQQASEENLGSLLQLLGLKSGKKEEQLVRFFVQEKLPMTKPILQKSLQLIQQMGKPEQTLPAIQMALNKGWPLSKETVQAVRTFLFEPPLQHKITELLPLLPQTQSKALQTSFSQLTNQQTQQSIEASLQTAKSSVAATDSDIQKPNYLRSFFQLLGLGNEKELVSRLRGFERADQPQNQQSQPQQPTQNLQQPQTQQKPQTQQEMQPTQQPQQPVQHMQGPFLYQQQQKQVHQQVDQITRQMVQQDQQLQQNMKLQLQQLLMDSMLSTQAKEKVEALISHITGQQLFMSTEGNQGPFHQLLFQFSFPMHQLDTIYGQIEGRKNEKGQIDPENCRLLFYLQLSSLGDTCVDVHIRSKMVSITIFNEHQNKEWLQEVKPTLHNALHGLGYSLSSISWKEASHGPAQGKDHGQGAPQRNPYSLRQQYQGVDIRI